MSANLLSFHEQGRSELLHRFLDADGDALTDAEILEMLLFPNGGGMSGEHQTHRLLEERGTLADIIHADDMTLRAASLNGAQIMRLKLVRLAMRRTLKIRVVDRPIIHNWNALKDYYYLKIAFNNVEEFHVLFLDGRHTLLADERTARGTVNHTPVYQREIIKRALELGATGLILVHNHPVDDVTPSEGDIRITHAIRDAGKPLAVTVHDHIIFSRSGEYSFRAAGLLGDD